MKKIINVLLCMGCVLACTACEGKDTEQNANTPDTTETTVWTADNSVVEDDQTLTPAPEGWKVVDTDTIEAHSVTRNFKTDGSNYFVSASQCQTENGYYTLEDSGEGSAIYYFDSKSHTYLPFELRDVIPILEYGDSDKQVVTGWIDKSEFAKGIFTIHEVEDSE
jgi:hypothetical protein